MSTNYTKNYNLCQWEPSDKVLREDFNADNAKLDAALAKIETKADAAKTQAQAITNAAYTKTGYTPFVVGYYSGNNAESREINLGFKPKAVLVFMANGTMNSGVHNGDIMIYGGLATEHYSCGSGIYVTDRGFRVGERASAYHTNVSGYSYSYIAFR